MSICSWSFGTKFDKQYLTASLIVAQFYLSPSFVLQLFHKLLLHPTILSEIMEVKKTAWLKRKLIWPLKSNLLRSMPRWAVFSVILSRCFLWPLVLVATWLMLDLIRTADNDWLPQVRYLMNMRWTLEFFSSGHTVCLLSDWLWSSLFP